ncbi:MAG: helix-turn-helix domain-containing protein [Halobacteriota archaeon]
MRYYRYVHKPETGYLHPIEEDVLPQVDAERVELTHLSLLSNENGAVVYRCRGSPEGLEELLREHGDVVSHQVFAETDEGFYLYVEFEPGGPATDLMRIATDHGLILDTPFRFTDEGLEITTVGTEEKVQESLPRFMELTRDAETALVQVGEFDPETSQMADALTDRQYEVVEAAVQVGYYSNPREATHEDVAERLGCTASTVGEHLRKVEAKLLPRVADKGR